MYTELKKVFKETKSGYEIEFSINLKVENIYFEYTSNKPKYSCVANIRSSIKINDNVIINTSGNDILKFNDNKILLDAYLQDTLVNYTSKISKDWTESYELYKKICNEVFEYDPHPKDTDGYNEMYYFFRKSNIKNTITSFFEENIKIFESSSHISIIESCQKYKELHVYMNEWNPYYTSYKGYFGISDDVDFILMHENYDDNLKINQNLELKNPSTINLDTLFIITVDWEEGYLPQADLNALNEFYRYYLICAQINGIPCKNLSVSYDIDDARLSVDNMSQEFNNLSYANGWRFVKNNYQDIHDTIDNIEYGIYSNVYDENDDDVFENTEYESDTPRGSLKLIKEALLNNYSKLNYLYKNITTYCFIEKNTYTEIQVKGVLLRAVSTSPFSNSVDYSGSPLKYDTFLIIRTPSAKFILIHAAVNLELYKSNSHISVSHSVSDNLFDLVSKLKDYKYIYDIVSRDLKVKRKLILD